MPLVCTLAPKGGAGATIVATNVAVGLARRDTCLFVDLHPEGGDADLLLGVPPAGSWIELLPVLRGLRPDHISRVLTRHPSGLDMLLAPAAAARPVDRGEIHTLIASLSRVYPWVVLDGPMRAPEIVETVLRLSSFVLLVTTPDPVALRRTDRMRERIPEDLRRRTGVVVNQSGDDHRLSAVEIASALGLPVVAVIPADPVAAGKQLFFGEPVVGDEQGRMGRALVGLAETLRRAGPAIDRRPTGRLGPAEWPRREAWPVERYR